MIFYNNRFTDILFFFFISLQSLHCGSSIELKGPVTINVNYQKISLQPLKGWENIISCGYWPKKENMDELLIDYIQQVWKTLYAEFRLCEKYGFYIMVDSTELHTVEISLTILSSEIRNDTLFIPIKISTTQKAMNKKYSGEINGFGILPSPYDSTTQLSMQDLVAVFNDYERRFPYKEVVAPYYIHEKGNNQDN